jgi:hypothetical protein
MEPAEIGSQHKSFEAPPTSPLIVFLDGINEFTGEGADRAGAERCQSGVERGDIVQPPLTANCSRLFTKQKRTVRRSLFSCPGIEMTRHVQSGTQTE